MLIPGRVRFAGAKEHRTIFFVASEIVFYAINVLSWLVASYPEYRPYLETAHDGLATTIMQTRSGPYLEITPNSEKPGRLIAALRQLGSPRARAKHLHRNHAGAQAGECLVAGCRRFLSLRWEDAEG